MSYKNAEDQKAAARRHYEANKEAYLARAKAHNSKTKVEKRDYINSIKSVPCTDCRNTYPPYVMQFDHIGTDKEFNVSQAATRGYGLDRIKREIEKCEVVCANCHAERTHSRLRFSTAGGS